MNEIVFDARAMLVKGIVVAIHDEGAAQTVDVQTHDGAVYSGLEVIQGFGGASVAPADGAEALVIAIGGDPAHRMAICYNPAARFGGLQPGESVLYGADGSRVGARLGGVVEVLGMSLVKLQSPEITLQAPNGVAITGPTTMTGDVGVTGTLAITGNLIVNGIAVSVP